MILVPLHMMPKVTFRNILAAIPTNRIFRIIMIDKRALMRPIQLHRLKMIPTIPTIFMIRRTKRLPLLHLHARMLPQPLRRKNLQSTLRTHPERNVKMLIYVIRQFTL